MPIRYSFSSSCAITLTICIDPSGKVCADDHVIVFIASYIIEGLGRKLGSADLDELLSSCILHIGPSLSFGAYRPCNLTITFPISFVGEPRRCDTEPTGFGALL